MVERRFLFLPDGFLEAPNILATINFDRKYAGRIFAEHPAVEYKWRIHGGENQGGTGIRIPDRGPVS